MPGTHTLHFGPFRVDLTNEQVWHGAAELRLRPHSFAVLRQLLTHAGQLLTQEALGLGAMCRRHGGGAKAH